MSRSIILSPDNNNDKGKNKKEQRRAVNLSCRLIKLDSIESGDVLLHVCTEYQWLWGLRMGGWIVTSRPNEHILPGYRVDIMC